MPLIATFEWEDSSYIKVVEFPNRPHGLKYKGVRPNTVVLSLEIPSPTSHLDKIGEWLYRDITMPMHPVNRAMIFADSFTEEWLDRVMRMNRQDIKLPESIFIQEFSNDPS